MFIVLCVFLAVVVAMLAVATILRRKETSTAHNKVGILERRLALFKSVIANVGNMLKHTAYFLMFLLSSIIGIFFMYLGSTGSWDATTIIMSMMGVMGTIGVWWYIKGYIHPWCRKTVIEAKRHRLICTGPAGLSKNHTDPFEKKRSEKVWEEIKELKSSIHLVGSEDELAQVQIRLNYLYLQLGAVSKELDPPIHGDMDRINIEIADSTFPEWMTIELRRTGGYLDHLWTIGSGDVTFHVSEVEKLILALQSCNANREELDNHYTVTGAGCSDHGLVTAKWR